METAAGRQLFDTSSAISLRCGRSTLADGYEPLRAERWSDRRLARKPPIRERWALHQGRLATFGIPTPRRLWPSSLKHRRATSPSGRRRPSLNWNLWDLGFGLEIDKGTA